MWRLLTLAVLCGAISRAAAATRCDHRPPRTTREPTVSSKRFVLDIPQMQNDMYLPDQQYEVTLTSSDPEEFFTAFMVWPEVEPERDPLHPYKFIHKDPGSMRVHDRNLVKMSDTCPNTLELINAAPTNSVKMFWKSPPHGNGLVTLHAMVAQNEDVWYVDGEGLIREVAEDDSFLEDQPHINQHCRVCEEAKYELTFEGKWSRNTHPQKFPTDEWSVHYGDLVGAAHSQAYSMWKDGSSASPAMKQLALHGDTKLVEREILENYTKGFIRTLIKGRGHGAKNGRLSDPTHALVRVDRSRHLISTATAMRPSPDWFLGVYDYELCLPNNTWLQSKTIELIPWDAGVDNGISYESPADPTGDPGDPIGRVRVGSLDEESPFHNMNYKQIKSFAALTIKLIRVYNMDKKQCEEEGFAEGDGAEPDAKEAEAEQPEAPARRTSPPPQSAEDTNNASEGAMAEVPTSEDPCPLSSWERWTPCSSTCGTGYRSRERFHLVQGVQYRYYRPDESIPGRIVKPSDECTELHKDSLLETEPCHTDCPSEPQAYKSEDPKSRLSRMTIRSGGLGEEQGGAGEGRRDCVMSSWSRWATCTGSCGEGQQMRARSIISQPQNGGRSCPKKKIEVKKCSLDPCPVL